MFSYIKSAGLVKPTIDHKTQYSEIPIKELWDLRYREKQKKDQVEILNIMQKDCYRTGITIIHYISFSPKVKLKKRLLLNYK